MKERPIKFSSELVRTILEGRKTQTRRPIKPQPIGSPAKCQFTDDKKWRFYRHTKGAGAGFLCPWGQVGDRLWVKEAWAWSGFERVEYKAFPADGKDFRATSMWYHPNCMPRKCSQITLEITDVRVERVMDITDYDAICEGFQPIGVITSGERFRSTFNSIYKESLLRNDWVWVIEFKRIDT